MNYKTESIALQSLSVTHINVDASIWDRKLTAGSKSWSGKEEGY